MLSWAPPVEQLLLEVGLDHNGEPAAFVTVVLKNPENDEPDWEPRVSRLRRFLWEIFRDEDVPTLLYTSFRLAHETPLADEDLEPMTA